MPGNKNIVNIFNSVRYKPLYNGDLHKKYLCLSLASDRLKRINAIRLVTGQIGLQHTLRGTRT